MSTPAPPAATTTRNLLKLHALEPSQLPPHPVLAPAQNGTTTDLASFVTQFIGESSDFADTTIPTTFKLTKTAKLPESEGGPVDVLAGGRSVDDVRANGGRGEFWYARRSRHVLPPEGAEEIGKASWDEFIDGLVREHSVKEGEYTPDIFDSRKLLGWEAELQGVSVEGWEGLTLEIYEMAHALGFPLSNRVFCTLVLTARDSSSSFVVGQIPVNLSNVPAAFYANGKHRTDTSATAQEKKKCVIGQYVSVERCRIVKPDAGTEGADTVQWDMATASDAKGSLPMIVQKTAVPGVIAKDVSFFMKWAAGKRAKNEPKVTSGGAAS